MTKKIFVLGGDFRLSYAASALQEKGFEVFYTCGLKTEELPREDVGNKIKEADVLLFGVPMSADGSTINAPFCSKKYKISEVASLVRSDQIIIGGAVPEGVFKCRAVDYLHRDDFAYFNAVPTAEGALEIAMRETNITVSGSRCLIIGYGRLGKILCNMFSGVGARCTAAARKAGDLAMIEAMGLKSVRTGELERIIGEYDIVVNTVPHMVIDANVLKNVRKDTLIIDTASKPGGVNMDEASKLGINVIWSLSLPGKVAPKTAGEIICNTSINILKELGV